MMTSSAATKDGGVSSPEEDPVERTHRRKGSETSLATKLHLPATKQKQRNGGGVLGALIASTGNISGAAAPASSTLAPNMKRPGYHLSRYSVEDDLLNSAPGGANAKGAGAERPKSVGPGTPLTWTETMNSVGNTLASKRGWTEKLRDIEHVAFGGRSGRSTPAHTPSSTTDREEWIDEKWARDQEGRREKRRKRKKAEVYVRISSLSLAPAHVFCSVS